MQIALGPIATSAPGWHTHLVRDHCNTQGITLLSGMFAPLGEDYSTLNSIRETGGVRSDALWPQNLVLARNCAKVAEHLQLTLVTFHAGFLPESDAPHADRALRAIMLDRLRQLLHIFADHGVDLALETGQETPENLLEALQEVHASQPPGQTPLGINFDPANIILYGTGDPVAALTRLAPHVRQVHIKDAVPTNKPGTWGTEVVVGEGGEGAVDWPNFFRIVRSIPRPIDHRPLALVIEREAGETRVADIERAANLVSRML
jgi:L-ribulose-5-phosphate 3-epimerase